MWHNNIGRMLLNEVTHTTLHPGEHTTKHGEHGTTHHAAGHTTTAGQGGHGGDHGGGHSSSDPHNAAAHGNSVHEQAILFVAFGLFVGVVARWFITRYRINLPYTVVLLLLGLVLAAVPTTTIGNLGEALDSVRHIDPHLLLGALIPALIFESAFATNYHIVAKEFMQCLMLAGPGVLINTGLTGAFMKFVVGSYGWSWFQCFLFGSIVSATDPVAVVALLRDLGASKRLATMIEGESLLNDGTAFVAYVILAEFVSGDNPSAGRVVGRFARLTFGGVFTGILTGLIVQYWLRHTFNDEKIEITITILSAYLCFHIAENEIGGSGVLACVFLGLVMSKYKSVISPQIETSMEHVWEALSYVANTIIFLIAGIIIMISFKNDHGTISGADAGWLLVIYAGIHVTRALTIIMLWPCMFRCGYGITVQDGVIMWYGALRGAIGLALGLITQTKVFTNLGENELKFKDLILFHTSGIVLLTLLVNATTIKYIVQYFKMDRPDPKQAEVLIDTMKHLRARTEVEIRAMKEDPYYRGSDWDEVIGALPNYCLIINPDMDDGSKNKGFCGYLCAPCLFCYNMCKRDKRVGFEKDATVQLLAPAALHVQSAIDEAEYEQLKKKRLDSARYGLDDDGFDIKEYMGQNDDLRPTTTGVEYEMETLYGRMLSIMKNSYWASYEKGLVSRTTVVILLEAVESGLDVPDLLVHHRKVREVFVIPKLLKSWFEGGSCHSYARSVLTGKVLVAIECGQQFEHAAHQVKHLLHDELEELSANEQVQEALAILDDQCTAIAELTHELQLIYPELTRSIQTRQAAQHIIHLERHVAEHMHEEGLIDEGEFMKMLKLINDAEGDLQYRKFKNVEVTSDDILVNLPFMSEPALPANLKRRVLNTADRRLVERGFNVYTGGESAKGAIVISRGRAELRYADRTIDTFTSGTFLCYDFFAGRPHLGDCVASTSVELYFIDGSVMKEVVQFAEVEASVWRSCATMLIRSYFMDDLGIREHIDVGRLCAVAQYMSLPNSHRMILDHKALLLCGVALKENHKQPILAPTVLLPYDDITYTFDQNAKILLFDHDVHGADEEAVLSRFRKLSGAVRRRSQVPKPQPPPHFQSNLLPPQE